MELYNTISKKILDIRGNNVLNATYIYSLIKKYRNYETNISTLTEESISKFTNISRQTISGIITDFRKLNNDLFCEITTTYQTRDRRINQYHFNMTEENFFYTLNDFYIKPLDGISEKDQTKCKGLLLRLKAICINNSNVTLYNKMEIANKINVSKATLNKYLSMLVDAGHIKVVDGGYFISNPFIIPDFIKDDIFTFNYHCIYYHCLENGCIPPIRDAKADNILIGKYILTDKEYIETNAKNKDNVYLPLAIKERLNNMPYFVNWKYILKALCNYNYEVKHNELFIML